MVAQNQFLAKYMELYGDNKPPLQFNQNKGVGVPGFNG